MEDQLILKYIHNGLSEHEKSEFVQRRQAHAAFDLLVTLVDACVEIIGSGPIRQAKPVQTTVDAEILLIRLLSFHINKQDAARFLASLTQPLFYQRVLPSLKLATTPETELCDAMPDIQMQTDEQIYARLAAQLPTRASAAARLKVLCASLRIKHRTPMWGQWIRKPALVALVGAVCLLAIMLPQWRQPEHALYVKYIKSSESPIRLQRERSYDFAAALRSDKADEKAQGEEMSTAYKLALASYMSGEFKQALSEFKKAENLLGALEKNPENAYFIVDYYFYYAMTHLNLAGARGQKKDHLDAAVRCFSQCTDFSRQYDIELDDDILFFSLLARHMRGDIVTLDETNHKLSQSPYSDDLKQLFNH